MLECVSWSIRGPCHTDIKRDELEKTMSKFMRYSDGFEGGTLEHENPLVF